MFETPDENLALVFDLLIHFFSSVLVRNSAISSSDSHREFFFSSTIKKQPGGPRLETRLINVLLPNQQPRFQADKIIDQPRFQSNIPLNRWYIARIFQIWPTLIGCKELAERFEPIRKGEIF